MAEQKAGSSKLVWAALAVVAALVVIVVARSGGAPTAPVAAGPEQTQIRVVSEPAGASVVLADGGVLGVTPFDLTLPKSNSELPIVVSHDGYQARHSTIPLFSASGRIDVALTPIGVDAAAPPKPPKDWSP